MQEFRYPKHAKPFVDMVWEDFDFDAVIEVLLDKTRSFPHHKRILFRALGGWIVSPDPKEKRDAIRMGVRLALASHEKKVLACTPSERLRVDSEIRQEKLADFLTQIYYPIGGARQLHSETYSSKIRERLERDHLKTIKSLTKMFGIIHYAIFEAGESHYEISLRRCYMILKEINNVLRNDELDRNTITLQEKDSNIKIKKTDGVDAARAIPKKFLEQKGLEPEISRYGERAGLCYAASFVEVRGQNLLSLFFDKRKEDAPDIRVKWNDDERRAAIIQWLGYASFVSRSLVSRIDSASLRKMSDYKCLSIEPLPLPKSRLQDWEGKIVKKVLSQSFKSN